MSQHLSLKSELSHVDWVIKGKDDGQDGGPPNFEQPIVVEKKKPKKNSSYDIIPSHVSRCMNNQKHNMMSGEEEVGVLKSNHKVNVSDIYDLAIGESMSDVPLKLVSLRNHHVSLMSYREVS